ncbi:hypothetical protein OXX79_007176 [Metschnikowia pulcherrima]
MKIMESFRPLLRSKLNLPSGPSNVIVTGSFDNWGKTLPLVKQTDGSFELTVPFPKDTEVLYKYVVDGEWLVNPAQSVGTDSNGIENNVLTSDELVTAERQIQIPEAGGLAVIPGSLNTTVMPSTEGQQTTLGEPGIFIPKDKDSLAAFATYEDTNRDLNNDSTKSETTAPAATLTPEERKKQKKKLKRTKYKLNKKAKAAQTADATTSTSAESTPVPEDSPKRDAVIAASAATAATTVSDEKPDIAEAAAKEAYGNNEEGTTSSSVSSTGDAEGDADVEKANNGPTIAAVVVEETVVETVAPIEQSDSEKDVAPVETQNSAPPAPYALTEKDLAESTVVSGEKKDVELDAPIKDEATNAATPYSLTENEIAEPVDAPAETKPTDDDKKEVASRDTLDPTVVGVVGAAAGAGALAGSAESKTIHSADAVATEISQEKAVSPSIQPAIDEPIEDPAGLGTVPKNEIEHKKFLVPTLVSEPAIEEPITQVEEPSESFAGPAFAAQLAPSSKIEDVPVVPVSNQAKEVTALPVDGDKIESEEEIIIAQGGHDLAAIEKQIIAAEDGPVSVEELQPTVSEAKQLAEEAHIPSDEIKAAPVPVKQKNASSTSGKNDSGKGSSSGKSDGKEKKKRGLFSKLKKIFK